MDDLLERPTTCATCNGRDLNLDLLYWGEILLCTDHAPAMRAVLETPNEQPEGIPGIYRSRLALAGHDDPQPVVLARIEDGGWWFYLPDSWPYAPWRGETRWFRMEGATFTPDAEEASNGH